MTCYHCGESSDGKILIEEKSFCCEGCKQVYLLLNENGLCNYYDLDKTPGITAKGKYTQGKFAYLDNEDIQRKLFRFKDEKTIHVQFYLPTMHCASCIWLLENLHRIQPSIISSKTNFQRKEIFIIYDHRSISLRKIVELLAFVGYEPHISLNDSQEKKDKKQSRNHIYKIGIAGFAFSNIMMLSFPEYFSSGGINHHDLQIIFTYMSLLLSLPVLLYSSADFFISGWKGLRQGWLNIDAPIALAIAITFGRSAYEIISGTGSGYLDSMSGIVFFMLIGRWFENRTYDAISFDRDYRSFFPLGVTILENDLEKNITLNDLKKGDLIVIKNEEMIPADGIIVNGDGQIDYSFVSGENIPVEKRIGELVYAGGKQLGTSIKMQVETPVSHSYITQLWNNDILKNNSKNKEKSFIHPWSRYFTYVLFVIAFGTAIFWWISDPAKIWPSVTAVLIVACPCTLLLSATFTYGNMLSIFGKNKLYLKNAGVIEMMGDIDTILLDKTGTITEHQSAMLAFEGNILNEEERSMIYSLTRQSTHPFSKIISGSMENEKIFPIKQFQEIPGNGLSAIIMDRTVRLGSAGFVHSKENATSDMNGIHIQFGDEWKGRFIVSNKYRDGIKELADELEKEKIQMEILSGDNDYEKQNLEALFGKDVMMKFRQSPQDKLNEVISLQNAGKRVMMLGDGLNDAGALMKSEVGIAVTDSSNLFSPASDGILDGGNVSKIGKMIQFAKDGKKIVTVSFILSILYNIIGLGFATQGLLSPMIAAILMPANSISIVLLVTLSTNLAGRKLKY
ncbi:MAG: heavy metal translocating P-type ATPase [Chitinophagaceae bacterium]